MALVLARTGLMSVLGNALQMGAAPMPQKMGLYVNNYTPTVDSVIGNFAEPVAGWYARQTIVAWTTPIYSVPNAYSSANPLVWVNLGGIGANVTVFGYFVVDSAGVLMWAERDPSSPIVILGGGGTYSIGPRLTYRNP